MLCRGVRGRMRSTRRPLPELTEADLEKLGDLLGHRKKLLKAIEALGRGGFPSRPVAQSLAPVARREAERRHLTVLSAT